MLIFWNQRLVILPVPKTGSTAVTDAVADLSAINVTRPPQLRHVTVQRYHMFVRPWIEDASQRPFRVVAVMREPESWLASWYRYRQRDDVMSPANSTRDMDFETFVRGWCARVRPPYAAVGSQERFLRPNKKKQWLDRLFRYEELDDFVAFLEAELGCKIALPQQNISPDSATELSGEAKAMLQVAAADDYGMYRTLRPVRRL